MRLSRLLAIKQYEMRQFGAVFHPQFSTYLHPSPTPWKLLPWRQPVNDVVECLGGNCANFILSSSLTWAKEHLPKENPFISAVILCIPIGSNGVHQAEIELLSRISIRDCSEGPCPLGWRWLNAQLSTENLLISHIVSLRKDNRPAGMFIIQ